MDLFSFPEKLTGHSSNYVGQIFPIFLEAVSRHGWNTEVLLLGADEWRIHEPGTSLSKHVKQLWTSCLLEATFALSHLFWPENEEKDNDYGHQVF